MPLTYAIDSEEAKKERKSFQILFSKLDAEHWVWNSKDTFDHGVDYGFEYIENNEYKGYRIISQIKSSSKLVIKNGSIPFDFPVKTASYAIGSAQPYIFFLVDLNSETVYYLPLQDYFIANENKLLDTMTNTSTVRVFVPIDNIVSYEDADLIEVAKSQYSFNEVLVKTR